jgi:hypothetical protein
LQRYPEQSDRASNLNITVGANIPHREFSARYSAFDEKSAGIRAKAQVQFNIRFDPPSAVQRKALARQINREIRRSGDCPPNREIEPDRTRLRGEKYVSGNIVQAVQFRPKGLKRGNSCADIREGKITCFQQTQE